MEKKAFLTPAFYANPKLTLDAMNGLVKSEQVADQENYQNGEFLFMEVFDNEDTRRALAPIIGDLKSYKKHNNRGYASDEETEIGLCLLHDEHSKHFCGTGKEIVWSTVSEAFRFVSA